MKQVKNDLTGKRFGRLTVIGVDDNQSRKTYYICKCDCGNIKTIRADALVAGKTISCGCRKKSRMKSISLGILIIRVIHDCIVFG